MPSQCLYGQNYDVTHAMYCKRGGFIIMRNNNVRDFESNLIKTTFNDVEVELKLQKVDNEELNGLTGDDARPDIRARAVWREGQNTFFDIRLTNSNACSKKHLPVSTILKKHEKENRNMELSPHWVFLTGGKGPETSMFHKHIARYGSRSISKTQLSWMTFL